MARLLRAYMFRNKDPEIDVLRTLIEDKYDKRINKEVLRDVADNGGPTTSTMRGWFFGKTQRPQNCTLEATGRALGMRRTWVRDKK